jgi:hypothetical protein
LINQEGIIMATAAQVRANRSNGQKSTGPRTAAGKERASQNAVKHGLLAREAVIAGEDPEEFESCREGMLLYERRIESSLYRTMAQLRQERQARAAAGTPGEVARSECHLQADRESVTPTRLASFGANAVAGG